MPSFAAAQPFAYILNQQSHDISVIDSATNNVIDTIDVSSSPSDIVFRPDGSRGYVSRLSGFDDFDPGFVTEIETKSLLVTDHMQVGVQPVSLDITKDGNSVFVANHLSNFFSLIDTSQNAVTSEPLTGQADKVLVTPNGSQAYFISTSDDLIEIFDILKHELVAGIVESLPTDLVFRPQGDFAYIASFLPEGNPTNGSVLKYDMANFRRIKEITLSSTFPGNTYITPDGGRVCVLLPLENSVAVVDTISDTLLGTVEVGKWPWRMVISHDGHWGYVVNGNSNNISVINISALAVVKTIPVGDNPSGIALTPNGKTIYVTNANSNNVTVIDTATHSVIATVPVGTSPIKVVIGPQMQNAAGCNCSDPRAINGTSGDDDIIGTLGDDIICGLEGNDKILGLRGNDCIDGGSGNDSILGGAGKDSLFGGPGSDRILGDSGSDLIDGGSDSDMIIGGMGTDTCKNGELIIGCEQ